MKSKTIWYSKYEYVDQATGEILTKSEVEANYLIVKKTKITVYDYKYINNERYTIGRIEITNECTRDGKQLSIW